MDYFPLIYAHQANDRLSTYISSSYCCSRCCQLKCYCKTQNSPKYRKKERATILHCHQM